MNIIADMLTKESRLDQSKIEAMVLSAMDKMRRYGEPAEDVEECRMQIEGGPCSICGKYREQVHSKGPLGEFYYWKATCLCLEHSKHQRTESEASAAERESAFTAARIPPVLWGAEWNNWDYTVGAEANHAMEKCCAYGESQAWAAGKGMILAGGVGSGKTRCAAMIMKDAIKRDPVCRPYFVSMSDIASQIIRGDGFLERLVTHRLVVIDDLDKVPQDKAWIKAQIFSLFDALVNERVAIIATTNATGIETIAETFDRAVTSRIMSACEFVQFPSGLRCDYRIKNIKKC